MGRWRCLILGTGPSSLSPSTGLGYSSMGASSSTLTAGIRRLRAGGHGTLGLAATGSSCSTSWTRGLGTCGCSGPGPKRRRPTCLRWPCTQWPPGRAWACPPPSRGRCRSRRPTALGTPLSSTGATGSGSRTLRPCAPSRRAIAPSCTPTPWPGRPGTTDTATAPSYRCLPLANGRSSWPRQAPASCCWTGSWWPTTAWPAGPARSGGPCTSPRAITP
mmetsp:Transcript_137721/g.239463  ORF Transcript_137721/g.239463 Transcript_137721/m.239463 type:complete len:218 (+) Transcript_137721:494-1147(+)